MKTLVANLSILATIVAYVYFERSAPEGASFLELPKKLVKAVNSARSLDSSQGYSSQACQDVTVTYDSSFSGTVNIPLFGTSRENYLETDIMSQGQGNEDYKSYGISFIPLVVPWFVLWILGIICNISLSCNQCCMIGCCKNCCVSCCRCCKKPKDDRRCCRIISGLLAMICALGVIGASVAGIVISGRLTGNYQRTQCAFFQAMDSIEYGNSSANWMGLYQAYINMSTLNSIFTSGFNSSNYNTNALSTLNTDYNALGTDLSTFYTTYQGQTISSAKPNSASTTQADIIANLGPLSDTSSWVGAIDNERLTKYTIVYNAATNIETNYETITESLSTYQSNINSGTTDMSGLNTLFIDIESSVYSYSNTGENIVSNYVRKALLGMFIGATAMGALTLICPICVCLFKRKCCNSMIFVAWESFSALFLTGFVVGVVSLVVGILITQVCDVMYKAVTVDGYVGNITGFISDSASYTHYVDTCLTGNGDIISQIGVAGTFSLLNNLETNITNAKPFFQSNGGATSTSIPPFDFVLTNTQNGGLLLVASSSNSDGTAYNLAQFNELSDYSISGSTQQGTYHCTGSEDQWVMNTENCTYSPIWTSSDTSTYNLGSRTCLGVESGVDTSTASTGRYYSLTGSCGSSFVSTLSSYRNALQTQFTSGQTGLAQVQTSLDTTIQTAWNTFATDIYDVTAPIATLNDDINQILTIVSAPSTGLIYNLNCSFFQQSVKTLNYEMCNGLVVTFYQITLVMLIMATFACFGSIFQFCFAKYMRTVIENKEQKQKESRT